MQMLCKRGLSPNETYVCSEKTLKKHFSNTNIEVGMGIVRTFKFDIAARRTPKIKGKVVMSVSISYRRIYDESGALMFLYPFSSTGFTREKQNEFESQYLPQISQWIHENTFSQRELYSGIYELIVEWYHNEFELHQFKFT